MLLLLLQLFCRIQRRKEGRGHKTTIVNGIRETSKEYNSVHVFSFKNMKNIKFKEFIQQFRHHGSFSTSDEVHHVTSDEVHHVIFKASKLLHDDDELLITDMPKEEVEISISKTSFSHLALVKTTLKGLNSYLALMKILTLQGLAVETVELKGGLLERFTYEMEPFLRKQDVSQPKIRLRPRLAILIKTLLKKNVYQEQGKLETETVPDKACNGTSILDSSEESKMGLDVRMCNGNGLQGVSVGLVGSMIYAPTIKKDYVGR
uniref:Uncharacterized protein n=1 Tax=Brassica oleracea var. oleracea TaxID=109376 RepID=A0A0D3CD44_BRAOL